MTSNRPGPARMRDARSGLSRSRTCPIDGRPRPSDPRATGPGRRQQRRVGDVVHSRNSRRGLQSGVDLRRRVLGGIGAGQRRGKVSSQLQSASVRCVPVNLVDPSGHCNIPKETGLGSAEYREICRTAGRQEIRHYQQRVRAEAQVRAEALTELIASERDCIASVISTRWSPESGRLARCGAFHVSLRYDADGHVIGASLELLPPQQSQSVGDVLRAIGKGIVDDFVGCAKGKWTGCAWTAANFIPFGLGRDARILVSLERGTLAAEAEGPLALTRAGPNLTQQGLEHIVERHWATSGAANAGKFAEGTTGRSLKSMIQDTVYNGSFRPNTMGRPGTIYEYDFGAKIGTDIGGSETSWLRVVLREDNTVTTAFPFLP